MSKNEEEENLQQLHGFMLRDFREDRERNLSRKKSEEELRAEFRELVKRFDADPEGMRPDIEDPPLGPPRWLYAAAAAVGASIVGGALYALAAVQTPPVLATAVHGGIEVRDTERDGMLEVDSEFPLLEGALIRVPPGARLRFRFGEKWFLVPGPTALTVLTASPPGWTSTGELRLKLLAGRAFLTGRHPESATILLETDAADYSVAGTTARVLSLHDGERVEVQEGAITVTARGSVAETIRSGETARIQDSTIQRSQLTHGQRRDLLVLSDLADPNENREIKYTFAEIEELFGPVTWIHFRDGQKVLGWKAPYIVTQPTTPIVTQYGAIEVPTDSIAGESQPGPEDLEQ